MADQEATENLSKMKVAELKAALAGRGLTTSGNKTVLIERLQAALLQAPEAGEQQEVEVEAEAPTEEDDDAALQVTEPEEEEAAPVEKAEISLGEADVSADFSLNESTEATSPPTKVLVSRQLSAEERAAERVKRFGAQSEEAKLKARAEKFGIKSEEVRKLERAQRFGITAADGDKSGSTKVSSSGANSELLKKRAERFGQTLSPVLTKSEDSEKMLKRKERFGVTATTGTKSVGESDEKKRKRAERFGLVQS